MKTTLQARSFAAKELKELKETKSGLCALCALLWLSVFTTVTAEAATRYVDANSPTPASPYTTWATAARIIQQAVNAAAPGDQILVTNGVYATDGRAVVGTMTNRVAVTKRLTVRSVNGPEFTVIQGRQVPGTINGDGAIRCVYLTNGASLSGFTLTNGATRTAGDAPFEQWGGGLWCESNTAVVSNCVIVGNSALVGGGVHGGTLINCTLSGNSAGQGGGAYQGALTNCILNGNSARGYGGGAYGYTFLNNCTLTGNSAGLSGGGTYEGTLLNCIVYFNSAADGVNYYQSQYGNGVLNYCCTTPLPTNGVGNITADPQLASPSHLSAASPCRGAGSAPASGTDIDGEAWANPPSIGGDEYVAGAVTGPLSVAIAATYTNVLANYPVGFTALIEGKTAASVWEFDDGLVLSNQPYASHSWAELGDHQVIVRAYNESQPGGISATVTVHVVTQPVHYVAADSGSPVSPYTSWATAATTIQDAVEAAAVPGALVLVTNGVYATGGRAVVGTMTNRVAVTKPLSLQSVNGPSVTIIQGYQVPGITNGDGAIRCVYLTNGASLSGFTLTNGATRSTGDYSLDQSGGGVWCESTNAMVSNCTLTRNSAYYYGGGAYQAALSNCTLTGNFVSYYAGGGAAFCALSNCTLSGNSAGNSGGGAYGGILNNCALTDNSASMIGGGAAEATLNNCMLTNNSAGGGGGAGASTLNNCILSGNSADFGGGAALATLNACTLTDNSAYQGGGADDCTLNNCLLNGNSATYGGGAHGGVLNNCTLTGNSASYGGGAGYYDWGVCTLNNCIVYFNSANEGPNYFSCAFSYSCTTPLPPGTGNFSTDPQLASATQLSAGSPCRGAGSAAFVTGTDIDGEAWANPPSIGCDEYHAGAVTGLLSVGIAASYTNVATGFPVSLTALIQGRTTASVWTFGDGLAASNQPYASHAWNSPGDYAVVLRAYNDSHPAGISATVTVHVVTQPVHYVAATGSSPVSPYTTWATAAAHIQDAVDAATVPGALVLVTNGMYASGGRAVYGVMTNRVAVDKPLTLRSVNGPQFTLIQGRQVPGTTNGDGAIRCVYLTSGASLSGFTLTNGESGGGVWCESTNATVSNCTLTGNSAYGGGGGSYRGNLINCTLTANSADRGGGAAEAMMNNCMLTDNSARAGGGAAGGTLNNCRLIGNKAEFGGGAIACTLNNCLLTGNTAKYGGGAVVGTLNNCTLTGNSASDYGGGAAGSSLLYVPCTLNNCIVYFNTANLGANYYACAINYSCTTPLPPGVGNFTSDPQLANPLHLRANSPCRGAGNATYTTGSDIDGEAWANPPSIGCDEYQAGAATGPLNVSIVPAFTNVATSYPVELTAAIEGWTTAIVWDFGDGLVVSNRTYASHAWTVAGDYDVVLRAYNDSHPAGISATVTVHVVTQPVHYVAADSSDPVPPFDSWATAATNIQDAVDAATVTGALVLVNDGVYATGGRAMVGTMTNRVAIDRPLLVESVNGPEVTIIEGRKVPGTTNGDGAIRCVYLTNGASLFGFTLTNGATRTDGDYDREQNGGGAWCESATSVISNCNLTGNSAFSAGGAYRGTLNNCTLISNTASGGGAYASIGGGAHFSILNDCTLSGNSAKYGGGGAAWSTLNNCALTGNRSFDRGGGAHYGILTGCTLTGNFGTYNGGGALNAILNNCTLSFNSAVYGGGAGFSWLNNCTLTDNMAPGDWGAGGGGADQSTLNNCIVYFNAGANQLNSTLNYSCTIPLPTSGTGNISDPPLFVDAGNLRLSPNSPCINAGNNAYAGGSLDLDGRPRIIGGTVDMGAYENTDGQTDNGLPWLWLLEYGLSTDGSADFADSDVDGHNNWQEWKTWTIPTDAFSVLRLLTPQPEPNGMRVSWQSVSGQNYFLERATNASTPFSALQSSIVGQTGTTGFTDTNAAGGNAFFYRVGVQ